ncbi:nitrogen permease regulator of amino acid transport activity 3-domain-containing protein [Cyathus striatus]|nr:nitrogen permease regulator of amino acid transport activity 3-domain-containing protein [Cyathus striatus]
MAEALIAVLLVTTSAKGSSLVYRWPPNPSPSPRLSRAPPDGISLPSQLDNPWKAAYLPDAILEKAPPFKRSYQTDPDYCWQRPLVARDRSLSFSQQSVTASGKNSPVSDGVFDTPHTSSLAEYDHVFGYNAEFLASMLCPKRSMCHQKFELIVDDLAFIGHPVCADADGAWRFKPEKFKPSARGRGSRENRNSESPLTDSRSESPEKSSSEIVGSKSSWLDTFHFVIVLDLPDPSSSASGNVLKYFDIIYEHIAFTITAVLYQEQVLSNFVEEECNVLGSLKDSCVSKGEPFLNYLSQALEVSSIAPAMKAVYEAIKLSSMAYITIHDLPLELQLPPYLGSLLHSEVENDSEFSDYAEDEEGESWGQEMSFCWRLPALVPWKSLLLLDSHDSLYASLQGPHVSADDQNLAEGLIRFLETASVTLSLADMASLLDWDLESQIYPIVRWLVHHRRAKIVDTVHPVLKTAFTLPSKFNKPLPELTAEFAKDFVSPVLSLPQVLAAISIGMSKQTDNHFFALLVKKKEYIPIYHEVVLWMLKRDMLVTLHLRIRIVATHDVKLLVRMEHQHDLERRSGTKVIKRGRDSLRQELEVDEIDQSSLSAEVRKEIAWLSMSPRSARRQSRRMPSNDSGKSELSDLVIEEEDGGVNGNEKESDIDIEIESELDDDGQGWETPEDDLFSSIIPDPGRATPLQRRWLHAMSKGKDSHIARTFALINQYFDGKKSDDEILYRAEISRKQLREVLHHYEEYLQTFLHP